MHREPQAQRSHDPQRPGMTDNARLSALAVFHKSRAAKEVPKHQVRDRHRAANGVPVRGDMLPVVVARVLRPFGHNVQLTVANAAVRANRGARFVGRNGTRRESFTSG